MTYFLCSVQTLYSSFAPPSTQIVTEAKNDRCLKFNKPILYLLIAFHHSGHN